MLDLVASARAEITPYEHSRASGATLLRNIVEANMNQDGDSKKLTEGEVLSDIFIPPLILSVSCWYYWLFIRTVSKNSEEVTLVWPADITTIVSFLHPFSCTTYGPRYPRYEQNRKECMDKLVRFPYMLFAKSAHTDSSQRNTL
ncbi:hypothetical protein J3R83DRAFT_7217 [Lanmaoa asiatica]|nr:hypothetical protein J3R83DRAFT_7217 [Lanmaoa asiatica]